MLLRCVRPLSVSRAGLQRYRSTLVEELEQRGFIQQITRRDELQNALEQSKQAVYAGIDPTAPSLHIGHLIPLMALLHFHIRGHTILPLIGGATGLIGDPSGRTTERQVLTTEHVQGNVASLEAALLRFFQHGVVYAERRDQDVKVESIGPEVKNNLTWHQNLTMLDFLRRVGLHARVNTMLNRESVRTRLDSSQGMSFTEFTYQLLQAYDFYHLNKEFECTVQIGGSDQWGNILAGLELISRLQDQGDHAAARPTAFGFTTPLLTTSSGAKFGKSAGNAIWLNPQLTSVFEFYQYFLKVEDADVGKYLKLFTLLRLSQIDDVMREHTAAPEKRIAQRRLADEVTELVHQSQGLRQASQATAAVFGAGSGLAERDAATLIEAFNSDPRYKPCSLEELTTIPVMKLASKYGLVVSTSVARQLIQAKGLYLNDKVVPEIHHMLAPTDLIDGKVAILRAGKGNIIVLVVADTVPQP